VSEVDGDACADIGDAGRDKFDLISTCRSTSCSCMGETGSGRKRQGEFGGEAGGVGVCASAFMEGREVFRDGGEGGRGRRSGQGILLVLLVQSERMDKGWSTGVRTALVRNFS